MHRSVSDKPMVQRQQLSLPLPDELKAWLEKNANRVPENSLTRTASQHMVNQWDLLMG